MFSEWWLTTWTTYGAWLPGDPRGYCTWRERVYVPPARYAKPGEATYVASKHATKYKVAKRDMDDPVQFTREQMQIAQDAIVEEVDDMPITIRMFIFLRCSERCESAERWAALNRRRQLNFARMASTASVPGRKAVI